MEQQMQYLMWLKSKQIFKSHFQPSMNSFMSNNNSSSWEEQAFAEDAAGPLGGFTWPPRSYSCTFCRREFKSAQALGGHMNVHRRDRARLKQSQAHTESPPPNSPETGVSGSPFSSLSTAAGTMTTLPILQNPISPQGSDTSNSGKFLSLSNQDTTRGMYNNQDVIVLDCKKDIVDTNLSLGINMIYDSYDNEESYDISSKRQRLVSNDMNSLPFASKRYVFPTEDVRRKKTNSSTGNNIDLELRLS